jgi:putative endonuclease
MDAQPCVYILSNYTRSVLYIGVTINLPKRIEQHLSEAVPGFTRKYKCKYLIYAEYAPTIMEARAREKQLKGWTRAKKEALIQTLNPEMKDLKEEFF